MQPKHHLHVPRVHCGFEPEAWTKSYDEIVFSVRGRVLLPMAGKNAVMRFQTTRGQHRLTHFLLRSLVRACVRVWHFNT